MTDVNIDTVARTLYGEARNQGAEGQQAVANVIMNRLAKKSWYGATPYGVCMKPGQFSCWNPGDPNKPVITHVTADDAIFAQCLDIAAQAVDGRLPDITDGATHYKVVGTKASWDKGDVLVPCKVIGQHEFFNNVN